MKTSFVACLFLLAVVLGCSRFGSVSNTGASSNQSNNTKPAESPSPSGARGTPEEAKAMLAKAVEHYNAVGPTQALADFNQRKAPFFDRDLYVACIGSDQRIAANGGFPQYVGQRVSILRDAHGKPLGAAIQKATETDGVVRYEWINPVSGRTEPKIGFFQKVGDHICGVGAYNPS